MISVRKAVLTLFSIVFVLILLWILVPTKGVGPVPLESGQGPSTSDVSPGSLDAEVGTVNRQEDTPGAVQETVLLRTVSGIKCQAVRSAGGRSPLPDVEILIQLDPPISVDPFSTARSASNGMAYADIPLERGSIIFGSVGGIVARRQLPAMTESELRQLFPDGIELDFFLEPAAVTYSVSGGQDLVGQILFLSIGFAPLERVVMPRDGELTDIIRPKGGDSIISGSFQIQAGAEIYWAILDQFGFSLLQGSSGKVLAPNDSYEILVNLNEIKSQNIRYFQIVSGLELFSGQFMENLAFQVFNDQGDYYGFTENRVGDSGRFSLNLPSSGEIRLILLHPLIQAAELLVGNSDGTSKEQPIQFEVQAATRLLLRKYDYPEIEAGQSLTVVLKNNQWRQGVVIEAAEAPEDLELIGGWCSDVHSFRLVDRLFLVHLKDAELVRLPCPEIVEVVFSGVEEYSVDVTAAAILEQTVQLVFMVRGEVWQMHRIYAPFRRHFAFTTRLPAEPGLLMIREGFQPPAVIPYTVTDNHRIVIPWINQ